jgi:hypothetical protein
VRNNGPAASEGAQVVDALPLGLTAVSAPGCVIAAGTVTCPVGMLANGASRVFTITASVTSPYGGPPNLTNTASIDAPGDTDASNNSASASTSIAAPAIAPVPGLSTWALVALALAMAGYARRRNAPG